MRLLPDTLIVEVTEHDRLAVWQANGRIQVIDGQGQVIQGADARRYPNLPLVVGTGADEAALRAEVEATVRPLFSARRYGDPALGQLDLRCAVQIRTGAESGAEMGAYEQLRQPQREANLRDALDEYLRLGLTAGLHYAN